MVYWRHVLCKINTEIGKQRKKETISDKIPLNKHVEDLQIQEGEMTKDFSIKIRRLLQEGVGFSQAGKGDRGYSSNRRH